MVNSGSNMKFKYILALLFTAGNLFAGKAITWDDPVNNTITGYELYKVERVGETSKTYELVRSVNEMTLTMDVTGLFGTFVLVAVNNFGPSDYSDEFTLLQKVTGIKLQNTP